MKIAVIDDERPARKELVHQIMDAMPGSQIEELTAAPLPLNLSAAGPLTCCSWISAWGI